MEIIFSDEFRKDFKKIKDKTTRLKIIKQLKKLSNEPEVGKPLKNKMKNHRSLRIAPHRIIYRLEKDKIIKAKEIEAVKTVSVEQIRQQQHSIKDEILTILISGILICTFLPATQPSMIKGFEILKSAPTEFWWAVLIVFSGSFGMSTLRNIKKK